MKLISVWMPVHKRKLRRVSSPSDGQVLAYAKKRIAV